MLPWRRVIRRQSLPLAEALADAEEELRELHEDLENATGSPDDDTLARLETAEEEIEQMSDEIRALREKCQELTAEVEALRARQTEEAVCAVFLDSSVGRALVAKLGTLQALETDLRKALSGEAADPRTALDEVAALLRRFSGG